MDLFSERINYIKTYNNDSGFYFLEANENWMVYRSEVSSHTTVSNPYLIPTVDIVFVGILYFELLSHFDGIEISKPNDEKSLELARKFDKGFEFLQSDERVLKIKSKNNFFYIVTAHLWIHEHNCQYRKSFIENFNYESYPNEYIKNWIKIK